jgi:hypothetical protein
MIKGPHGCLNSTNIYLCIPIGGRGPIYGTISLPAALVDTTRSFTVTFSVQGTAKDSETQIFAPIYISGQGRKDTEIEKQSHAY